MSKALDPPQSVTRELRDRLTDHVRALVDSGPWSVCWVGIFRHDWDAIAVQYGAARRGKTGSVAELRFPDSAAVRRACRQAAEREQPLALPDIQDELDIDELLTQARAQRPRALLILPVQAGDYPGVVWFGLDEPRKIDETELAYARFAATRIMHQWHQAERIAQLEETAQAHGEQLDELAELHSIAAQQKEHYEELVHVHDSLLPLVLNEHGLTSLIEAATPLVGKSMLLFDHFDRLLAHSETPPAVLQTAELGLGPHLRTYFDTYGAKADFVTIGGQRFLIIPLFSERRTLGNLCISFSQPPSDDRETKIAEHTGLFFALELLKQRIRLDVQLRLASDFFRSLLSEIDQSPQVADRAALHGLDLARSSAVLRVRITPAPRADWFATLPATAWLLRAKLAEVGASAVVTPSSNYEMVIIVNADPAPLLREQVLPAVRATLDEVLSRYSSQFVLDIGIGTIGIGVAGIRASHDTAIKALTLIDALGLRDTDLDITDFATYGLLLDIDASEQEQYIHRVVAPIEHYDTQHSTELLKTLECFLDMLGSVQRTASKLYLHPTTVRYRLARAEELTGLRLDNSEHRLALSLALRLHRLRASHPRTDSVPLSLRSCPCPDKVPATYTAGLPEASMN